MAAPLRVLGHRRAARPEGDHRRRRRRRSPSRVCIAARTCRPSLKPRPPARFITHRNLLVQPAGGPTKKRAAPTVCRMVAAITPLPVVGVPVKSSALSGNDSLLSIVQVVAPRANLAGCRRSACLVQTVSCPLGCGECTIYSGRATFPDAEGCSGCYRRHRERCKCWYAFRASCE